MVLLTMFIIVVSVVAWLIAALFLAGSVFSVAFKNFDIGYDIGYAKGLADRPETINPFGTILADNADLDEIMVIRYDDQLPHRYKRVIVDG